MALPRQMQAARITEWNTPYKLTEVEVPVPQDWQLLLKTKAAGYCHTDLMVKFISLFNEPLPTDMTSVCFRFKKGNHLGEHHLLSPDHTSRQASSYSLVTRHENWARSRRAIGLWRWLSLEPAESVQIAPGTALAIAKISQSQQFPVTLRISKDESGSSAIGMSCDGAFAEYCLVDARSSAFIPETMSFAQACPLACAGVTIYKAIKRTGLEPRQILGIVGLGALGVLGAQMACKMGLQIVGVDSRSQPVELARTLVAEGRFIQGSSSMEEALQAAKDLNPKQEDMGVDAVILAADAAESVSSATSLLKKHGTFLLLAACACSKQLVLTFF